MHLFVQYSLLALAALRSAAAVSLSVSTTGGNASSPILYGLMFEDINNSGDGGIHGQVLKNNGLQGYQPSIAPYAAVGGSSLSIDASNPLTSAINKTLKVTVPSGSTGQVGWSNNGYNGVPVSQATYSASFWVKGTYSGPITVSLVGPTGTVYGKSSINVNSNANSFTSYNTTISSQNSPSGNNTFQLTFTGNLAKQGYLNFGLPQLFPPTYYNRANGLRNDVASFAAAMKPSFLRWPGGNNIEGNTIANRWKWNMTIGPVQNRPGRMGTWGYENSDALGLMEFMQWTTDMGMQNVLAIWAGLALDNTAITGDALDPYVDDVMNELEFLLGSTSTTYGALRAQYGYPAPYTVQMIEIGNEDNVYSNGCKTYAERFTAFYNAIHAKYPNIQIIASTADASCLPSPFPSGVWQDIHFYLSPNQFVAKFNEWDNQPRSQPIFVGEYGSTSSNTGAQTYWTDMTGSCGEAVYMIGMERNSDVVKMASFAPMLEHFDLAEWSPDLFGFNSSTGSITGSTSYYVQKLFSTNRGKTILPVTSDSAFGPVYWVASTTGSGIYYVKLANYGTSTESVTVKIRNAGAKTASLQLLSGPATGSNYPLDVTITPTTSSVSGSATGGFTFSMPAYAVGVLVVS